MPEWTDQQINAIESTDGSVLVSAAAGSGKTAVLVERVIRMFTRRENPLAADRALIVTFTRDAASEMKQRINRAIDKLLDEDPYNSDLLTQKQRLASAHISTIDSFCGELIREYFHTLDISADFRVADPGELEALKNRALDRVFDTFYQNEQPSFDGLLQLFAAKKGDADLRRAVLKIADFLETQPFPGQWLEQMAQSYTKNFEQTVWYRLLMENARDTASYLARLNQDTIRLVEQDDAVAAKYLPVLDYDRGCITRICDALGEGWEAAAELLGGFKKKNNPAIRGMDGNFVKQAAMENRKSFNDTIVKELAPTFLVSSEQMDALLRDLAPHAHTLARLTQAYLDELFALKRAKNVLSFADTELLTVQLLAVPTSDGGYEKTPQANEIASRFDTVIVDEYQDVNAVQDMIFQCVSQNQSNLFVVGDVKQSIYVFRGAKPALFLERKNSYNRFERENPTYPATIFLDKNFRSRREVCDTVNFIFSRLMTEQAAQMNYTVDDRLYVGAAYPASTACETELVLIDKKRFEGYSSAALEARFISARIHKMMHDGFTVTDKKSGMLRPVEYGDFAVILRSTGAGDSDSTDDEEKKKGAGEYVKWLKAFGVPAFCEDNESFFDTQEVKLLLNLLRVIDNPTLDIPLLAVLYSPLYGFTSDELALMRSDSRHHSLYHSLCRVRETLPKADDFLNELARLRRFASACTVDELLGRIFDTTAIGAVTSSVKGGFDPLKNLNLMRVYARKFEKYGYKTLSDFLGYIERLLENGKGLDAASNLDLNTINGVRVLSIHKSKGLEFPVCFIGDTARRFNDTDLKSSLLIDAESGLGFCVKNGIVSINTPPRTAIRLQIKKEQLAEELRVLYVALTRAREKLILIGTPADAESLLDKMKSLMLMGAEPDPYDVLSCNSNLKWLMLASLANPSVRSQIAPELPAVTGIEAPVWQFSRIETLAQLSLAENGENLSFAESEAQETEAAPEKQLTERDYAALLRQNLAFAYPNTAVLDLPQKVSASALAHSKNTEYFDKVLAKPAFLQKDRASSVERGTAHHEFLHYCDFSRAREDVHAEIQRLNLGGKLTDEQADAIDADKLSALLHAPLFDRVLQSPKVYREERFAVMVSPSLIDERYAAVDTDCKSLLQGAIDLAFVEDGRLVIVDYKTDRVSELQKLGELYQKQLLLYREAMEQSLGIPVSELIICSVHLNAFLSL